MSLTDNTIRNAKAPEKPVKLYDAGGLFLLVTPAGGKWWRFKYRLDGKEKLLSLGTYPDTTVKTAREKRDEARRRLAQGIDPSADLGGALPPASKKATSPLSRTPRPSGSFCGPSTATKVPSPSAALCAWPRWCSSGRGNCARRNGPSSTLSGPRGGFPPPRMKMKDAHIVPLSSQALTILREWSP